MKHIESQVILAFANVLYRHAEITSGAYKNRDRYHNGGPMTPENEFTDEKKLEDSLYRMQQEICSLANCVDIIGGNQ
jgi:hypothetical protein